MSSSTTSSSASPDAGARRRRALRMAGLADRRRHPVATLLLLVAGLAVTGGLYSVVAASGTAAASSTAGDPSQIEKGHQLFLEGCSSCHGLNAQGQSNGAGGITGPSLVGVGAAAVDFQVGTGRMPLAKPGAEAVRKPPSYTQGQIDELAAYIASLAPGPAIPSPDELSYADASLQQGGELFRTNCAQCHNFAGSGGALGYGQYAPALTSATPKQIWEAMLTGPESMPVFSNNTVTPTEKQQIIKYIETLKTQPNPGGMALGRLGPVSEGLFLWIVGLGVVLGAAVWIGAKAS